MRLFVEVMLSVHTLAQTAQSVPPSMPQTWIRVAHPHHPAQHPKLDMLRGRLESLQRTEKEMDREQKRLAMQAKVSVGEEFGSTNVYIHVHAHAARAHTHTHTKTDAREPEKFVAGDVGRRKHGPFPDACIH